MQRHRLEANQSIRRINQAVIDFPLIGIDGSTQEEKKANSMLIAAAPELLAVLERVQSMFSYQFEGGLTGCMADLSIDVRAAIAKATGGAQ